MEALVTVGLLIVAYLAPTIIACSRHHHQTLAIAVLNILAGWSGIGWLLALVWSCTAVREQGQNIIIRKT